MAFPTETVYGLGANALDEVAVARIFEAKGRPSTSPLIVHVDSIEMARNEVAAEWPAAAQRLAERFWPGPLTLVLSKRADIPDRVTAGLATVGVRVPAHPIALELIRLAKVPIAAPSANRFTELSPTTAEHVRLSLGDRVAMILDGGPTQIGIESTVISVCGLDAVLLRPGMLSQAEIENVIGPVVMGGKAQTGSHLSPGMHSKHYSPKSRLVLTEGGRLPDHGRGAYLYWSTPAQDWSTPAQDWSTPAQAERLVRMPSEPGGYAAALYAILHELDRESWDWIAVERPPLHPAWAGILDRLQRAAGP